MRRTSAQRPFVQQHRGAILGGVAATVVVAIVGILVLGGGGGGTGAQASTAAAVPVELQQQVTQLPASVYDAVGGGTATKSLKAISAPDLTADGKPLVLYVGGEFCPFCAAQRWPLVMALSRFGTFEGLKSTTSSTTDVFPNTATFSFDGATYTSQYLSFEGVEQFSNKPSGSGYEKLQSLTSQQQKVVDAYNPGGGVPFIDLGGKYTLSGATYSPGLLAGMNQQRIADLLPQTSTAQSQAIVGSADELTAALCKLTNGQPGSVCQSPGVTSAAGMLPK